MEFFNEVRLVPKMLVIAGQKLKVKLMK